MKFKIRKINFTLLLVIIIKSGYSAFTQESQSTFSANTRIYIGLSGGPSISQEINTLTGSITGLTSTDKNTYSGSFELGYFFSKNFGLTTGIEYSTFSSDFSLTNYENKFTTTDTENDTYERRISGSGIMETQDISFVKVPVCLNLRLIPSGRLGIYLQAGVGFALPISNDYKGSGTFTYVGYYPAYNVTLQNLIAYGFPSNAPVTTDGQLELKSYSIEGVAGAGISCFITKRMQLALGAFYTRSISTISNYRSPENFQLSTDTNGINSLMGGSSEVIAQSMGLRLSLRYYIK